MPPDYKRSCFIAGDSTVGIFIAVITKHRITISSSGIRGEYC